MTTILKWLNSPPVLAILVGVGVLLDVVLLGRAYDLTRSDWAGWVQAIGSIGAIIGAVWVANRTQNTQQRNATALVAAVVAPTVFALDELRDHYGRPTARENRREVDDEPELLSPEDWSEVRDKIDFLVAEYDALKLKIHRIESALNLLRPQELRAFFALETELENMMRDVVTALSARASESGLRFYPGPASWRTRFTLGVFADHIHQFVSELTSGAR